VIRKERIYNQEALAAYIEEKLEVPYTFQIAHGERILTPFSPFSALFNPPNAVKIKVVYKLIQNKKKKKRSQNRETRLIRTRLRKM